jgi:hypothetical protein
LDRGGEIAVINPRKNGKNFLQPLGRRFPKGLFLLLPLFINRSWGGPERSMDSLLFLNRFAK